MRKFLEYDFNESKKRIIISTIIFIIAVIFTATTADLNKDYPLLAKIAAICVFGLLIGGFPYGWKLARAIIRPTYNEFTDEYYYIGGVRGMVIIFPIGITLGLFVGGILFSIDILRTIIYLIINKYKNRL
ncbi:MAG: hypothetical protein EWM47_02580 [Anaerolineaceae bacterium]|nr:MAG: hypothetical protein EWM47_02580 [Anaerolineaceae bacterium]